MHMKWNTLRPKLARFATYKYIIVIIIALSLISIVYLSGAEDSSISEDISLIVNKTSVNDTAVNDTTFRQECSKCHNSNMTLSGINKGRCSVCHDSSHALPSGKPSRYTDLGKKTVHREHVGYISNRGCTSCHGIPKCSSCHNGHSGIPDINLSKDCVSCHGVLPEPMGHNEERTIFEEGSHKWMNRCDACHLQSELRFKDIAVYNRTNSSHLCSNCHPEQYGDSSHYVKEDAVEKQSCVSCHNPHSPAKARFSLEGFSTFTGKVKDKVGNLFSYLRDNKGFVGIFVLLLLSVIFEHLFGPKKGQVILTKVLKIEHDKSKARTIKVSLSEPFHSAILDSILGAIKESDVKVLGMSAGNDEIIIFISKKNKDKNIINNIKSIHGVSDVEYTKDYETK